MSIGVIVGARLSASVGAIVDATKDAISVGASALGEPEDGPPVG